MRPSACRRGNAVPAAIVVTVLVAAALVARVPADAHGARSAERSVGAPAQATAVTVVDDFEDPDWPDPDLWRLVVDEDAEYTWGPRTCRASSGTRSLWAVGGGALGGSLRCRSSYPAGVASRAVVELDLGPYASARPLELAFDIASDQLSDSSRGDFLSVIYRRPDPEVELERVPVIEWTGSTGPSVPFQTWRIDLRNVVDRYDDSRRWDVAGGKAEFEFQFTSGDDSSDRGEGPHIDRLRLEYGGIPQVVPTPRTPRPTRTPTPTATSTPTITPTPSRTPTVTATPIDRRHLSLPYLLRRGAQPPKQQVEGLVIVAEPERPTTLYRFGTTSRAAADVLGALYDDPVDLVGYEPRASILSSLPRPGDEGLRARTVSVEVGERYVDPSTGEVRSATERLSGLVQLRVKFELLPSLAWEDGVPVTADDAVLGHRLACDPSSPPHPWSDACSRTASVTRLDERSIEWQGIPGFGDPSYLAVVIPPMPRHQRSADGRRMESMTAAEVAADPNFRWRPLSYGPFRLTGWAGPDRAALVPNEHYWRSAELLPYLEQLVFDFHRDAAGAVAQFAAGRADVVGPFRPTAPAELGVPEIARPHVVIAVPGPEWVGLVFDVAPADDRPSRGSSAARRARRWTPWCRRATGRIRRPAVPARGPAIRRERRRPSSPPASPAGRAGSAEPRAT